jgi:hypothetical protein
MRKEIDDVVGFGRLPSMSDKPNLLYCEDDKSKSNSSTPLGNKHFIL